MCRRFPNHSHRKPEFYPRSFSFTHLSVGLAVELFSQTKPKLIVEVGSFKGGSAIVMAKALTKLRMSPAIVCIGAKFTLLSRIAGT